MGEKLRTTAASTFALRWERKNAANEESHCLLQLSSVVSPIAPFSAFHYKLY